MLTTEHAKALTTSTTEVAKKVTTEVTTELTTEVTTIDLLRHGQTQPNDILRGRVDVELSEHGYQQMADRIELCLNPSAPWHHLITSPLRRCALFTEDLSAQINCSRSIDKSFVEIDYGDWDGRRFDEIKKDDPMLFEKVWSQPDQYSPPNGESFQHFYVRISQAWQNLVQTYRGKHVLLICHGGVIRALLGVVMKTPLTALSRMEVPYACLSQIKIYHHGEDEAPWPQLVFHNKH